MRLRSRGSQSSGAASRTRPSRISRRVATQLFYCFINSGWNAGEATGSIWFDFLSVLPNPFVGLLAGGQLFRGSHLRSKALQARLARFITLCHRESRPEVRLRQVPGNAAPGPIVGTQCPLCKHISLFGSALEPLHGNGVVLRNALTVVIADAQIPLCVRITLLRQF